MTPTIIQSDREMAAALYDTRHARAVAVSFREGHFDHWEIVQTIARAHIAGWNAAVEAAAKTGFQRALNGGMPRDVFDSVNYLRTDQEGKNDLCQQTADERQAQIVKWLRGLAETRCQIMTQPRTAP